MAMDEAAEGSRLLLQEEGGGGDQEPLLLPQVRSPFPFFLLLCVWFKFYCAACRFILASLRDCS
uniref:Uncharacterized protein n=1 Tax=Setaria italica TaxID=4555 RepID=K4AHS4_SETIT